jgi:GMP synthase-like glutamine amidotransferase
LWEPFLFPSLGAPLPANKFAVYITGDPSDYTRDRFGDYGDLFRDLLKREGDQWDFYDSRLFEYPANLSDYQGIVITGSPSTAHELEDWIVRLNEEIRRAFEQNIRILGVCFGHQAVANALGGKSERNPKGWEAGLYELEYNDVPSGLADLVETLPRKILEIHMDHVVEAPPEAQVFAKTEKTPIQAYAISDRVLCLQGHPEFNNEIVRDLVRIRARAGIIDDRDAIEMLNSMAQQPERVGWVQFINRFLRD